MLLSNNASLKIKVKGCETHNIMFYISNNLYIY